MSLTASPKLLKAGMVVRAPGATTMRRTISLQYNPDSLSRSFQILGVGGEGCGERAQPFRLKGAAIESFKLESEIDAADQLECPDQNPDTVQHGIQPQLAGVESLVNPTSAQLLANNTQIMGGTLEIAPMEAPLTVFFDEADALFGKRSETKDAHDRYANQEVA